VRTRRRALVWLLASVVAVLGTDDAWPAARHHVPTHLKYASAHRNKAAEARHYKRASERAKRFARLRQGKRHHIARKTLLRIARPFERVQRSLPPDLAAVKQALELVQQGKLRETTALTASIGDPVAQKLVEWAQLRHAQSEAPFERYAAFIRANPDWPSIPLLRRRAEVRLWQEPRHAASARRFLAVESTSSVGRSSVKQEVRATQDSESDGVSVADWHGGLSISATPRPPIGSCARLRLRSIPIIALNFTSCPAGSRFAFSMTRPPR